MSGPTRSSICGAAAAAAVALALLTACGGDNTGSNVVAPGAPASASTRVLEAGAAVLQKKPPIDAINAYLDGFHRYADRPGAQMEAHHYCTLVNDDLIQCVIYDGNVSGAKLMGVEYIVSAKLFAAVPDADKPLWHSHVHEVRSGQLVAPGIPEAAELALMRRLVGTYGKTWHTWHTDQHEQLPIGRPALMMGLLADGELDAGLLADRDRRFGVASADKRKARADIAAPPIDPRANGGRSPP